MSDSLRDRLTERSQYDDCAGSSVIRVEDTPAAVAAWLRDEAADQLRLSNRTLPEWRYQQYIAVASALEALAVRLAEEVG